VYVGLRAATEQVIPDPFPSRQRYRLRRRHPLPGPDGVDGDRRSMCATDSDARLVMLARRTFGPLDAAADEASAAGPRFGRADDPTAAFVAHLRPMTRRDCRRLLIASGAESKAAAARCAVRRCRSTECASRAIAVRPPAAAAASARFRARAVDDSAPESSNMAQCRRSPSCIVGAHDAPAWVRGRDRSARDARRRRDVGRTRSRSLHEAGAEPVAHVLGDRHRRRQTVGADAGDADVPAAGMEMDLVVTMLGRARRPTYTAVTSSFASGRQEALPLAHERGETVAVECVGGALVRGGTFSAVDRGRGYRAPSG